MVQEDTEVKEVETEENPVPEADDKIEARPDTEEHKMGEIVVKEVQTEENPVPEANDQTEVRRGTNMTFRGK